MSADTSLVVAITGAGTGIGAATAEHLARQGHRVVLGARRTERLDEVAGRIRAEGGQVCTRATDVTQFEDVAGFVDTAVDEFGRLDVLVGNAGISRLGPLADGDVAGWSAMIDVNLRGVLHGLAVAMPVFRRQGAGHFVTTLSTSGLKIVPSQGVYAATKNAVRTLLEAMRQENTDGVVRTTAISPGMVATDLADSIEDAALRDHIRGHMAEYGLDPRAVARAVEFAITQPPDVEIGDITIRPTVQN
ncbi:SDR family oxidoreductase [Mycobacterium sp. WMMD1722]|uniref:SDR family oxidoreductase n=1 Tax=Mycobacterium sp. WMMD1722 TaxID=3404117 RepID=UPI003BF5425D